MQWRAIDPPKVLTSTSIKLVDCVNIPINDDNISEPTKFFSVNLTSTDFQVIINMDSAFIFIAVNDGKICSLLKCTMNVVCISKLCLIY